MFGKRVTAMLLVSCVRRVFANNLRGSIGNNNDNNPQSITFEYANARTYYNITLYSVVRMRRRWCEVKSVCASVGTTDEYTMHWCTNTRSNPQIRKVIYHAYACTKPVSYVTRVGRQAVYYTHASRRRACALSFRKRTEGPRNIGNACITGTLLHISRIIISLRNVMFT